MEYDTKTKLGMCLESQAWKFAKTMPDNPHFYTLKKTWSNKKLFERCVVLIRELGKEEYFRGWPYTCFYFNDYKYWSMGFPVKETILINRKNIFVDQ